MWSLLEGNLICVEQLLICIFEYAHKLVSVFSALKYFFLELVKN